MADSETHTLCFCLVRKVSPNLSLEQYTSARGWSSRKLVNRPRHPYSSWPKHRGDGLTSSQHVGANSSRPLRNDYWNHGGAETISAVSACAIGADAVQIDVAPHKVWPPGLRGVGRCYENKGNATGCEA